MTRRRLLQSRGVAQQEGSTGGGPSLCGEITEEGRGLTLKEASRKAGVQQKELVIDAFPRCSSPHVPLRFSAKSCLLEVGGKEPGLTQDKSH